MVIECEFTQSPIAEGRTLNLATIQSHLSTTTHASSKHSSRRIDKFPSVASCFACCICAPYTLFQPLEAQIYDWASRSLATRICIPVGTSVVSATASRYRFATATSSNATLMFSTELRRRMCAQRHLGQNAERPERSREQFGKVVSRNVFHHASSASGDGSVREHCGDPEDEIAHAAKANAQRAAVVRRDHAADRAAIRPQRIDRKVLLLFRNSLCKVQRWSHRFDRDRHVLPSVVDNLADALE